MNVSLITIGDELLIGQVVDTNSAFMAQALSELGHTVVETRSVADTRAGIWRALEQGMEQADVLILSGGLGPTKDDITRAVLAAFFDDTLVFHEPSWQRVEKMLQHFGRRATDAHRIQCMLPARARVLTNKRGAAPGLWIERDGKIVIALPGVPYEMRGLMREQVLPRLTALVSSSDHFLAYRNLMTAGEGESRIAERLATIEEALPAHIKLAYLPRLATVRLRLTGSGTDAQALQKELDQWRDRLLPILGPLIFAQGEETLSEAVGRKLVAQGAMLALAESCTGGQIAHLITSRPGSSAYFAGGIVSYANELKVKLLGVPAELIEQHGAVSEPVVRAMAEGVIQATGAQYSIATSGIAGPGGGTKDKPVGTIWLAVSNGRKTKAQLLRSGKDRKRNIEYTALRALNELRLFLQE